MGSRVWAWAQRLLGEEPEKLGEVEGKGRRRRTGSGSDQAQDTGLPPRPSLSGSQPGMCGLGRGHGGCPTCHPPPLLTPGPRGPSCYSGSQSSSPGPGRRALPTCLIGLTVQQPLSR